MTSEEKKDRPINMISEAAHYNLTSDYAVHPMSPLGRVSYYNKHTLFISTKLFSYLAQRGTETQLHRNFVVVVSF